MSAPPAGQAAGRGGFRDLRVVEKVEESSLITSFHLEPVDPEGWRGFQPGQFLVLRIPVDEQNGDGQGHVLRNYSLSGSPYLEGRYRISVKREASPAPGLPHGNGSCFLHDAIDVGDRLVAEGPRGDFVLDRASSRPVVLISGGVGLTPMVSMMHALTATPDRRVAFIHACEDGDVHALRDEVSGLAAGRPEWSVHFCYRSPSERDRRDGRFHSEGVVSRELLQRLLPIDDYEFYLCGPPPFMAAVYGALRGLGVERGRIAYEFFGPATVLEAEAKAAEPETVQEVSAAGRALAGPEADAAASGAPPGELRRRGRPGVWGGVAPARRGRAGCEGLTPDFSCRAGICGTCKSRLISGEVAYFEEPLDEPAAGEVLLCCSRPRGPVVLDL